MASRQKAEDNLFAMVEKLVQTASLASHRRNLRTASNCLKRAYAICTKQVEAGSFAGRVCRAMVTLQLCALSSRAGHHAEALEEALKAVLEAEEVWSAMNGAKAQCSPSLVSRALAALVQAKHCVAIELEYNLTERTKMLGKEVPEAEMIREQMIPSLHREASALARQMPSSSALRRLSERTQAQEASRRGSDVEDPILEDALQIAGGALNLPPPGTAWPSRLGSPSGRRASQCPSQVAQSLSNSMESPKARARPRSAPSSLGMARIQKLEEQALDPPSFEDFRLPTLDLPLLQEPPLAPTELKSEGAGGFDSCRVLAPLKGNRKGNPGKAPGIDRLKRTSEETGDVFQDWLESSSRNRNPKGENSRLSEGMLKSLKEDFKLRYRRFQEELPYFSAQDLYENKIMFSHYGMKIRNQAKKEVSKGKSSKEEKGARSKLDKNKAKSQGHHQNLLSVKSLATMLQQSHDNHPHAREFYKYVYGRPWGDDEIFESLRQAFHQTNKET